MFALNAFRIIAIKYFDTQRFEYVPRIQIYCAVHSSLCIDGLSL